MSKKALFSIVNWIMITSLLLGLVPSGVVLAKGSTSPAPAAAEAAISAAVRKTAAECGVSAQASMGQDLELVLMNSATKQLTQLDMTYNWKTYPSNGGIFIGSPSRALSGTTVAGTALGNDAGVLVWDAVDGAGMGLVNYRIWEDANGFQPALSQFPPMNSAWAGSPAVAALNPAKWFVFHRNVNGGIEHILHSAGQPGAAWEMLEGRYIATSDPVPVVMSMNHMLLFFVGQKDSSSPSQVFFSEYQGGAWRSQPVELGLPDALSGASQITAVAAGDKRAAVFVSGPKKNAPSTNAVYAREWTGDDPLDWSGTSWKGVSTSENVGSGPIVSTSRTTSSIAVAYTSADSRKLYIRERATGDRFWTIMSGTPLNGPEYSSRGAIQSFSLVSPFSDEMTLLIKGSSILYAIQWNAATGWAGAYTHLVAGMDPGVQAAVRAPHTVFTAAINSDRIPVVLDYGNTLRSLTAKTSTNPTPNGVTDQSQLTAKVDGKSYWVNLIQTSTKTWRLELRNMSAMGVAAAWATGSSIDLQDHANSKDVGESNFSLAAADMDLDGRDEIVVATLNDRKNQVDLSWVRLTPGANGALTLTKSTPTRLSGLPASAYVQVAIADADDAAGGDEPVPDGRRDEVFLSFIDSSTTFRVYYYQFAPGAGGNYSLQARNLESFGKAYKTLSTTNQAPVGILRMAAGHTNRMNPGDSLVFLAGQDAVVYQLGSAGNSDVRDLKKMSGMGGSNHGPWSRLALADVNGDGLQEVIFTAGMVTKFYLVAASGDPLPVDLASANPLYLGAIPRRIPTLTTGDLDQDGRADVIYDDSNYTTSIFKSSPTLPVYKSHSYTRSNPHARPLVADLDNDSLYATLVDCMEVGKLTVQTVSFAPPVYYSEGAPLQTYYGEFGTEAGKSEETTKGYTFSVGGAVGIGAEVSQSIPLVGTQVLSFRTMTTLEMMGSVGKSTSQGYETSVAQFQGFYDGLGQVIYVGYTQNCYRYSLSDPNDPSSEIPVTICTPASKPTQHVIAIEDWYDPNNSVRSIYAGSWFELPAVYKVNGAPRNDIRQYPALAAPPVDSFQVLFDGYQKANLEVPRSSNPGLLSGWSIGSSTSNGAAREGSLEVNLTRSLEMSVGPLAAEASFTTGIGNSWGSSQTWSESLHYAGVIYAIPTTSCPEAECPSYFVTPYVYQAMAKAPDSTYPYVVQDYYRTPDSRTTSQAAETTADAAPQQAPMAPIVISQSHYDPNTWYPHPFVDFSWRQPEEDTATLAGYQWLLNESADITPEYADLVNTDYVLYENLKSGIYYMHVRAVGVDGSASPWSTYMVKVDNQAPEVKIELNPSIPNGVNGWYTGPVTVSISALDEGSGVQDIHYSTNDGIYQPYFEPLVFDASTPEFTLSVQAFDNLGQVSAPVTTTIKIDLDPPNITDVDGNEVSYTSLGLAENGNTRLKMGGVLSDPTSGGGNMMVKAGENGDWRSVDQIGDLPMPPDNQLTSTQSYLNWIYTPSFDVRGVYPLYGYGTDQAGNLTPEKRIGTFQWEPEARPDFNESMVSASRDYAKPGDTIEFTIAAHNTGYQESLLKVTDTLPAGLSLTPDSMDEGGAYDAETRTIVWELGALWPRQTRYLHFSATVDANTAPAQLTNQVSLEGYWEWLDEPGVPAEPAHEFFTTTNRIDIVTSDQEEKPGIIHASIIEGLAVSRPNITLALDAESDAQYLYVKEWTWDTETAQWSLAQESGWAPLAQSDRMAVQTSADGTRVLYNWSLTPGDGVHYLGVWVANQQGDANNLNEGNMLFTNLVSNQLQILPSGQRIQYRFPLDLGQLAVFNLVITQGDGDLHVWGPRESFYPTYYSNAAGTSSGVQVETVAFFAEEAGVYTVEIEGASDGDTEYQMVIASVATASEMTSLARQALQLGADATEEEAVQALLEKALTDGLSPSVHTAVSEKDLPSQVMTLTTPFGLEEVLALPLITGDVPVFHLTHKIYVPVLVIH